MLSMSVGAEADVSEQIDSLRLCVMSFTLFLNFMTDILFH